MKEIYIPKKVQDIICELAETKNISYKEAEDIIVELLEELAEKQGANINAYLSAIQDSKGAWVMKFIDMVRSL